MYSPFCKTYFRQWKPSILKCLKGISRSRSFEFMAGWFRPPFLLIRNKLLKNSPFEWQTFEMEHFSSFAFTSRSACFFYYWFNFATYGAFSCTGSIRRGFGNLLLKPRDLDLLSVVSKLGEIPLSSLLGHILESFDWKILFLELNEHEFIPAYLSWPEVKFGCSFQGVPFFWNKIYLPL